MQLLLERRIDDKEISKHITFAACTNRATDRSNVSGIIEPVKSRFGAIINLEVESEDWVSWAVSAGMPTELKAFIRFKPTMLHEFQPSREIANYPCPRTIAKVGTWINNKIPKAMELEVIEGAAGKAFAIEFGAFLNYTGIYRIRNQFFKIQKKQKCLPPWMSSMLYVVRWLL
ncbi:MAG: hypothetical protein IPJ20_19615 [Flammeovirgaceae bacterium]|nr:hypothetical protein [Flammeovirgaceae bacterium]